MLDSPHGSSAKDARRSSTTTRARFPWLVFRDPLSHWSLGRSGRPTTTGLPSRPVLARCVLRPQQMGDRTGLTNSRSSRPGRVRRPFTRATALCTRCAEGFLTPAHAVLALRHSRLPRQSTGLDSARSRQCDPPGRIGGQIRPVPVAKKSAASTNRPTPTRPSSTGGTKPDSRSTVDTALPRTGNTDRPATASDSGTARNGSA